jgi:hypothetical protein
MANGEAAEADMRQSRRGSVRQGIEASAEVVEAAAGIMVNLIN